MESCESKISRIQISRNVSKPTSAILAVFFMLGIVSIYNHGSRWQPELVTRHTKLPSVTDHLNKLSQMTSLEFDAYCEAYGEWRTVTRRELYVKRGGAFYFVDVDHFKVLVLANLEQMNQLLQRYALR
jgi:hypothetical protein